MFTAIRAITLAAAVMLAAPGTGATQVGDFMKVPQDVWTNINRFVFLVALDVNTEPGNLEYQRRSALASWAEVYAASQQWARETFPALQRLAAELVKDDIGGTLQRMLQAAEAIAQGRGDQRAPFEAAATAIEGRITTLLAITETTMGQIARLDEASRAVRREYQQRPTPDPALLEIEIRAENASEALRAATNAWSGLQSDVKELRRVVGAAQKVDPDLYARIGTARWTAIARDAQGFMTDMKTQQRYLRGEDYYDNCRVEDGRWYMLEGGPQPIGGLWYLTSNKPFWTDGKGDGIWVTSVAGRDEAEGEWRFSKLGKGWWRVTNRARGGSAALDGGRGGAAVTAACTPLCSGQYWRTLRVREGRCRLVNLHEGAGYSLEADTTWKRRVTLVPTTDGEAQQWRWNEVPAR